MPPTPRTRSDNELKVCRKCGTKPSVLGRRICQSCRTAQISNWRYRQEQIIASNPQPKKCSVCHESKSSSEFEIGRTHCKSCRRKKKLIHYYANQEAYSSNGKRWNRQNKDKVHHLNRGFRKRNPNYQKEWRIKHLQERREYEARWRRENYHRFALRHRHLMKMAKARRRGSPGNCTLVNWTARLEYFGYRCVYCGTQLTLETATRDHKVPVIAGGPNWPSNLVPACLTCNTSKHALPFLQFRKKHNAQIVVYPVGIARSEM